MSIRPSISNYGHEAEKEASGQASGVCLDKTTPRMTWVQSENLGVMHDARAIKSRGNGRSVGAVWLALASGRNRVQV